MRANLWQNFSAQIFATASSGYWGTIPSSSSPGHILIKEKNQFLSLEKELQKVVTKWSINGFA
jgi:hypothetical protein